MPHNGRLDSNLSFLSFCYFRINKLEFEFSILLEVIDLAMIYIMGDINDSTYIKTVFEIKSKTDLRK